MSADERAAAYALADLVRLRLVALGFVAKQKENTVKLLALALLLSTPALAQNTPLWVKVTDVTYSRPYTPKPLEIPYASDCRWNDGPLCVTVSEYRWVNRKLRWDGMEMVAKTEIMVKCSNVWVGNEPGYYHAQPAVTRCELGPGTTLTEVMAWWAHEAASRTEADAMRAETERARNEETTRKIELIRQGIERARQMLRKADQP